MTISIRRAVEADIPAMGTLDVAGYRGSAFRHAMFPPSERVKPGDEDALEWFAMGARQCLESTSMLYMVAVEAVDGADETVVGMAIWTPPRVATPATKKDTDGDRGDQADIAKQEKQESKPAGRPPGLPSYLGYEAVMEAQEETQKMLDSQTILPEKERNGMWCTFTLSIPNPYPHQTHMMQISLPSPSMSTTVARASARPSCNGASTRLRRTTNPSGSWRRATASNYTRPWASPLCSPGHAVQKNNTSCFDQSHRTISLPVAQN